MPRFSSILGTLLIILILLYMGPTLVQGIKEQYQDLLESKTKVGRIKIDNTIDDISFNQQQIEKFFKNNAVKALLLEIDSPGGAAGSAQALFNEIMQLKTEYKKPVVVLSYNLCTSAAYYVACASDYIITSPSALIGGIGTYLEQIKLNKLAEHCYINYEIEKSGDYKAASNWFTPLTAEQKKMLQETTESCYKQFIHDVAQRRGLSLSTAHDWANGRIFTGNDALKLHLVDEIGSEYNARQKIKQLALIERDIEWIKPIYPSWWSQILSSNETLSRCCSSMALFAQSFTHPQAQLRC